MKTEFRQFLEGKGIFGPETTLFSDKALWKNLPPSVVLEKTKQIGHLRAVSDGKNVWWGNGNYWYHPEMDLKANISSLYIMYKGSYYTGRDDVLYDSATKKYKYRHNPIDQLPIFVRIHEMMEDYNKNEL